MSYLLTRLTITGPMTITTPIVVLEEVAKAHSIKYNKNKLREPRYVVQLINSINTIKLKRVSKPYSRKDYEAIARYVNGDYSWNRSVLLEAFDFLLQFTETKILKDRYINFDYGEQTPENYKVLNASVLYGICRANQIDTTCTTSVDEMAYNIKLLFSLSHPKILHSVRTRIHEAVIYGECTGFQLVNIFNKINHHKINLNNLNYPVYEEDKKEYDYLDLREKGADIKLMIARVNPVTYLDAVCMAAIYYKIDISMVQNPIVEYQELTRANYFPIDQNITQRIRLGNKHPENLLNPYLIFVFNPKFPDTLYEENDLEDMCKEEGYDEEQIIDEGAYNLLRGNCLLHTFYHGKQLGILNQETTMMEEIQELDYDEVVVYGEQRGDKYAYTYGELKDTFRAFKNFQRPNGNTELFSEVAINKLYILANKDQRTEEKKEHFNERMSLANEMDIIRLYLKTNQNQVKELLMKYDQFGEWKQYRVREVFKHLMKMGMYMRGWKEDKAYPLESTDTLVPEDEFDELELRVHQSIIKFEELVSDFSELKHILRKLPLIKYDTYSKELLPVTDEREGLTVIERIEIVKEGDTGQLESCIRMSSNRIVASAYYYMKLLRIMVPFHIEDLADIS